MKVYEGVPRVSRSMSFLALADGPALIDPLTTFVEEHQVHPHLIRLNSVNIDYSKFVQLLKRKFKGLAIAYDEKGFGSDFYTTTYLTLAPGVDILFERMNEIRFDPAVKVVNPDGRRIKNVDGMRSCRCVHILYDPAKADVADQIVGFFRKSLFSVSEPEVEHGALVGFVFEGDQGYEVQQFGMVDMQPCGDLTLHYGEDMPGFHTDILNAIGSRTKGLVLLHGEAGTGKSFYLRHLIQSIADMGIPKPMLYLSPTFIENLSEPSIFTFMSRLTSQYPNGVIVIVEDADNLINGTRGGFKTPGYSNLSSATDGLLNDLFGMVVIATCSGLAKEIDESMTRSQRLIAQREFNLLPIEAGRKLAYHLGLHPMNITGPMTVAAIYDQMPHLAPIRPPQAIIPSTMGFGR